MRPAAGGEERAREHGDTATLIQRPILCTVMAAVDTVTEMLVLVPDASLIVTLHVPAATGAIAYVALPLALALAVTVAIVPLNGAHVSDSVNAPVYPFSVTVTSCGAPEANEIDEVLAEIDAGVGAEEGDGEGWTAPVGGATLAPPPPQLARRAIRGIAMRFT